MLSTFVHFIDVGFPLILVRLVSARRQAPALEVDLCRWEDFNFSKAFHSRFDLAINNSTADSLGILGQIVGILGQISILSFGAASAISSWFQT